MEPTAPLLPTADNFAILPRIEPSTATQRIFSLDVLRGLALLGALFISICIWGGFSNNQQNGLLLQSSGWNYRLYGAMNLLLEGKMRALICIVFGAGMCMVLSSAKNKDGLSAPDYFTRRQLWLIVFGLINGLLLLWTDDLLFHLGIMGILLLPFTRLSVKSLLIASLLVTVIYAGKIYWSFSDHRTAYHKYVAVMVLEKKLAGKNLKNKTAGSKAKIDSLTKEQQGDKTAWEGISNNFKYTPGKDSAENKAMRVNSYSSLWNHLLPKLQAKESQWTYRTGIWDLAGMILLGMAVYKSGFFTSRFKSVHYLLAALLAISAGLLLGWFRLANHQVALHNFGKYVSGAVLPFQLFFPFERAFLAIGYTCLLMATIASRMLNIPWRAFAAVGRMPLTNYLLQSAIGLLFFTGFGMGYFGMLKQHELYFLVLEIGLVEIAFSICWLKYYRLGPIEWLWQCLIYGKRVQNKLSLQGTPVNHPVVLN